MKHSNTTLPWTRLDWLNLLLFALLVSLFFWRILTPNLADRQSFPPGDFSHQFWAFATFEVRELSAGRLPLWNPYTFAGAPFWADVQSAVFYPPSLLTILLSAPWGFSLFALEIEAIAHFWLAAAFMYLFSRRLTRSRSAAFIAALTFTFSGYLTGYPSQQLAVLEADVWLPLILFFLHKAAESWKNGRMEERKDKDLPQPSNLPAFQPSIILAGTAWGLTLLAGHPQSALIVAYLSIAYLLFLHFGQKKTTDDRRMTTDDRRPTDDEQQTTTNRQPTTDNRPSPNLPLPQSPTLPSLILNLSLFLLTGLGLAAIQFIPAAEYTLLSVRAEGSYEAMAGGFPLIDLIQILLPGQVSVYSPLYISIAGLLLAGWVTFTRPTRHTIFWAIVAGLTLLITFGGNTFLYSPLYLTAPGFSIFRGQERWAFATAFSLCVLVGYGVQALLSQVPSHKTAAPPNPQSPNPLISTLPLSHSPTPPLSTLQSLTTRLLLFALLLTFLCFYGLNDSGWTPDNPFFDLLGAATFLTVILGLTWLLWKLVASVPMPPLLITILIAALIGFDLFSVNWQTNLFPHLPEWHTRMPAAVAAIKADAAESPDAPYRVYNEFRLYDNYGVPFAIEDLWGASPLRPARYDAFLAPPMPIERTWELLNVKYVITWREELFAPSTIIHQEPAADGTTYVHRLDEVGPRAWLVTQADIADDATILQTIADPTFDRWQTALLEPEAAPYVEPLGLTTTSTISDTFYISRFTMHTPQHLSLDLASPTPALLILSEPHYPDWQAAVDGQSAPLLRAYYTLRAIPLPAGEQTVELHFRPTSFIIGAIISGLTLIVIATRLIVSLIANRRQRSSKQHK